jgi:hypothetical protein
MTEFLAQLSNNTHSHLHTPHSLLVKEQPEKANAHVNALHIDQKLWNRYLRCALHPSLQSTVHPHGEYHAISTLSILHHVNRTNTLMVRVFCWAAQASEHLEYRRCFTSTVCLGWSYYSLGAQHNYAQAECIPTSKFMWTASRYQTVLERTP